MSKLKEAIVMNRKGFALMHQLEPRLFWSNVIQGTFEAVYPFIPFYFTARILTQLLEGSINNQLWYYVIGALVTSFLSAVIANGLAHTRNALYYRATDKKEMLLNQKIIHMDYEFVEDTAVHEQLNSIRLTEMTGGMGMHRIFDATKELVKNLVSVIISFIFISSMISTDSHVQLVLWDVDSNWIAVAFGVSLLFYLVVILYMNQKTAKEIDRYLQGGISVNNIFGYVNKLLFDFKSGKEIRLYKQHSYIDDILNRLNSYTREMLMGIVRASSKTTIVSNVLSYAILTFGYLWIIGKALNGAIPSGAVIQYAGALNLFIQEFPSLLENVVDFINNTEPLKKLFDFLEMKTDRHEGTLPVEKRLDNEYTLEARNVSFAYPGSDEYVLKNVNLKLEVGEKLAIVGMNGSGKTTLIKLLCRLYDPTEGQILLNGIDIRKYDYQEYLRLLAVVFQDFQLYAFHLGENVAASKVVNEESAVGALEKAGFSERGRTLKDGLDTYLYKNYDESGIEVSGGEAQKIAMARAIYKKAPIVILDEPTAALDRLPEFEMYTNFSEVVGNRSAIYISHRLSSVRFCDRIAVFEQGAIIQEGTHSELVQKQDGKYFELWHAQAQYYQKDKAQEVVLV